MSYNLDFENAWNHIDLNKNGYMNQGEFKNFLINFYRKRNKSFPPFVLYKGWAVFKNSNQVSVYETVSKKKVRIYVEKINKKYIKDIIY